MTNKIIVAAAMMGMIGAAAGVSSLAYAADANGPCLGANSCKGDHNGCAGQGSKMMTKAKCEALAKKNPKIKWGGDQKKAADDKKS